jgi:hypothetical protein
MVEEIIVKRRIRLRGINGDIEGKVWESDTVLRAGKPGSSHAADRSGLGLGPDPSRGASDS